MTLAALGADAAAKREAETARELGTLQKNITRLEQEIARDAKAKPTAGKALREAELAEADARRALREIRAKQAAGRQRERELRADISRSEAGIASHRAALESQLRLAYVAGREEWVRLALTERDPAALARRVTYYRYVTGERARLLGEMQQEMVALEKAATALQRELAELAGLGQRQEARVKEVSAARAVRASALQTMERDLGSRRQKLERLRREARSLQELVERLARANRVRPPPADKSPATPPPLQVKDLPLRGRMVVRYGQPRADGLLRWDGLVLAAPAGTEVRAVRAGRVAYADWLPGMGLLMVLDHGNGYMSLYGHNQDLLRKAGDQVRQGEVLSRVGDSGGQGNPGLYFELRRNGKPVDPKGWVR